MTSHQVIKKGSELTVIAASPRPEGPRARIGTPLESMKILKPKVTAKLGIHGTNSIFTDPMNFVDFYEVNLGKHTITYHGSYG